MTSCREETRLASTVTSRWISISIDVPGSSRTSAPRVSIPTASPVTPPIPAPIPAPFAPLVIAPITAPVVPYPRRSQPFFRHRYPAESSLPNLSSTSLGSRRVLHRPASSPYSRWDKSLMYSGSAPQRAPLRAHRAARARSSPGCKSPPDHDPLVEHKRKGSLRVYRISSLAVFVEIACFSDSGTLVPAGMISVGFSDSTEGAAGFGTKDDCAAAIPANSTTQVEAARIFIAHPPLQDNLTARLPSQMRPLECPVS
jgi:hypothetical protein